MSTADLIITYAIIGAIISVLSRLMVYINDPSKITRKADGSINWGWCLFENIIRTLTSTLASIFVGLVILPHVEMLDQIGKFGVAGMSAIVGCEIWDILGTKARKMVSSWMLEDSNGSNDSESKNRKGRRQR